VTHTEHEIQTPDGTTLHVDRWTPAAEVRRVVVIAHGGLEHAGRYARLAELLGEDGALVFGPDHRGQGLSGGRRGHIDRIEDYAADLRHVIEQTAAQLPEAQRPSNIPWLLLGHSMGGLIALMYLLDHDKAVPLTGVIVSAPLIELAVELGGFERFAVNVLGKIAPRLALPQSLPPETICRDPEEVQRYAADPRRATKVTAGWAKACEAAAERVKAEAKDIELPMLWYVGSGDQIVKHEPTQQVFASMTAAAERDQTMRTFEGYYHELHNEPEALRAPVLEMLRDWVAAHG
jgi:alpha-beta hydrolase superfamily lysophospholipase